ncbi:MAG: PP2C family protein-serine/threonine phosphatase [Planctomycetia bacterium]
MAASRSDASRKGSRRGEEAEPERPARGGGRPAGGSGGGGGGMGGPAKVALAAALVTAVVVAASVLPGRGGGAQAQAARDSAAVQEAGLSFVGTLAAQDSSTWLGGRAAGEADPLVRLKKQVRDLFGDTLADRVDEAHKEITKAPKDLDPDEQEDHRKRLVKFEAAVDKMSGGGGAEGEARAKALITRYSRESQPGSPFQLVSAFITEGKLNPAGKFVLGTHAAGSVVVEAANLQGTGPVWGPGTLNVQGTSFAVTVFGQQAQGKAEATAWVAISAAPAPEQGGGGLGMLMLVLGPVLVGAIGFVVANGMATQVRNVAREIERAAASGGRGIRAQGAEASAVARAVERAFEGLSEAPAAPSGKASSAQAAQLAAQAAELAERESRLAGEIHQGLINKHPPRLTDYEVEHLFKPGADVGGDHFDYFQIDDTHLGVILLDTNVRGIPAALVMSAARAYVRAAAPGELSPAAVLKKVNKMLAGELPPGRHVTAVYAVVDTATHRVTLASAVHLPVLVWQQAAGKMGRANPGGLAMGMDAGPVFDRELQEQGVALAAGDRLVLYTDGALLVANEAQEEFGEQRFYAAVMREAPKNSQAFVNFVGSAIDAFHLQSPQGDDITISTIKRLR